MGGGACSEDGKEKMVIPQMNVVKVNVLREALFGMAAEMGECLCCKCSWKMAPWVLRRGRGNPRIYVQVVCTLSTQPAKFTGRCVP